MSKHKNSKKSIKELIVTGNKVRRMDKILEVYNSNGLPLTDRDVLNILNPSSDDLNYVRPRISELLKEGRIKEICSVKEGNRTVRMCGIKIDKEADVSEDKCETCIFYQDDGCTQIEIEDMEEIRNCSIHEVG